MSASHRDCQHLLVVGQRDQHVRRPGGSADVWDSRGCSAHDHQDAAVVWHARHQPYTFSEPGRDARLERGSAQEGDAQACRYAHVQRFAHPWGWTETAWESRLFWNAGVQAYAAPGTVRHVGSYGGGLTTPNAQKGLRRRSGCLRCGPGAASAAAFLRRQSGELRRHPDRQDIHSSVRRDHAPNWRGRVPQDAIPRVQWHPVGKRAVQLSQAEPRLRQFRRIPALVGRSAARAQERCMASAIVTAAAPWGTARGRVFTGLRTAAAGCCVELNAATVAVGETCRSVCCASIQT